MTSDCAALRTLVRRLNKGKSGWLVYDHEHRAYVCCARRPNDERGFDVIGYYTFGAGRADALADMAAYELENPALRRRAAQGGKRYYRERVQA